MPIAELPQARQKAVRRNEIAALSLDRLDQHRRDFARGHVANEQLLLDVAQYRLALIGAGEQRPIIVRIGDVSQSRHRREEALLLGVLARREGQRAHGAAVKAAEKSDEASAPGDVARELERSFHAFRPGLCEKA